MKNLYLAFLLLAGGCLSAQDAHFTQWWAAPVAMNPAMTGNFDGLIRATFNYRNQWFLIPTLNQNSPYQTFAASVDASLSSERLQNNKFGVGLMFYNDRAGDGSLSAGRIRRGKGKIRCGFRIGRC